MARRLLQKNAPSIYQLFVSKRLYKETLSLEVKAPYIGKSAEQVKQLHDYNQSGAEAEVSRVYPGMKKVDHEVS